MKGRTPTRRSLRRQAAKSFAAAPEKAAELLKSSRAQPGDVPPAEFAAWVVTASAILNLDEFLTRN